MKNPFRFKYDENGLAHTLNGFVKHVDEHGEFMTINVNLPYDNIDLTFTHDEVEFGYWERSWYNPYFIGDYIWLTYIPNEEDLENNIPVIKPRWPILEYLTWWWK